MSLDTILGIAGFALGIIGLIAGYVFYRKGMKIKDPAYSIKSYNVIAGYSSKYKNLTVSYKKEKIENFTISKILFYNRGAETITRQDIATLNQIKVITNLASASIIDASVIQVNNPSSDFNISLDKTNSIVNINFDYLDKNHGAVIEVIHTGLSSDDLEIVGDIKGVQKISQVPPSQLLSTEPFTPSQKRFWGIAIAISLASWCIFLFARDYMYLLGESDNFFALLIIVVIIVSVIFSLFAVLLGLIAIAISLFTVGNRIPMGLEKIIKG
jgi:hypothetical protein